MEQQPNPGPCPLYSYFDDLPLGLCVTREGRVVYVNEALMRLVGYAREEVLGRALLELLAQLPGAEALAERYTWRERGEPEPLAYETLLPTRHGPRRVEVFVTRRGSDLIGLLRDVTGRSAWHQALQRLATLGASLPGAYSEEGVLQRMSSGLEELGLTHAYLEPEGERLVARRAWYAPQLAEAFPPPASLEGRWSPALSRAWQEGACWLDDMLPEAQSFLGLEASAQLQEHRRPVRALHLICVRIDVEGKPRALLAMGADWLREEELPPLRLFGAQVAAALEAARTISRLSARNQALTALNRLASLAASVEAPQDLFAPGAAEIRELLGCDTVSVLLRSEGATEPVLVYKHGLGSQAQLGQSLPLAGPLCEQVMREGVILVAQPDEVSQETRQLMQQLGLATLVMVPLRVRSRMVGTLMAGFLRPRRLSALELETLQAMGTHFAAATESHRLLAERARLYDDLKRSYAELERTQQQLVQRERLAALGELSAVVAHEVRNPLGAIFNSLATLRRLVEPGGVARPLVEVLEEEAHRLDRLVDDMLGFARPALPTLRPVELLRVVQECVQAAVGPQPAVQHTCGQHGAVPEILADERMVRHAFLNLALNAAQAMQQGGALRVEVRRAEGEPEGVEVSFSDTGPGIPPELRARVFEPFFTTKASGTGLGLALVKRVVEAHAGRLEVECPPAGGTTFRVWLPARPEPAGAEAP